MSTGRRNPLPAAVVLVCLLILAGCSANKIPGVYRLNIQQGNVITQEMLDQLDLGMDRRKVRFILGTPLLTDTFNQDRWDYLYSLKKSGGERVQRHVSLFFENDLLVRIEGDIRSGPVPEGVRPRNETIVTVPAERRKEGFLAGLIPDFRQPTHERPGGAAATPTDPLRGADSEASAGVPALDASGATTQPETLSAEDSAYLEKLFGDYGKLDAGKTRPPVEPEPQATRESASP